ncbi:mannitol dehydrogenase [Tersicoccus solisilvae]|uniref:Mannitol dehydrogenase n=1 Tax=Tersicoccus solisilvae TaxID=1882339 RepID=A0ABQ1P564_9MICC|nr:mannitol dehydrogenase family protein [Tersicoccus solisilvae]GGC90794.1 mannitol dehydrogenase [Tersicoccus solisilvae]
MSAADARPRPLTAATAGVGPRPPVRLVHLGLGAFHRAHQAWYTEQAADEWGIAAFTGRSPEAAEQLTSQDGLYTLVERAADGDRHQLITALVEAHDGADLRTLTGLLASPDVAVVTLTITEAGYRLARAGDDPLLNAEDPVVAADVAALRAGVARPEEIDGSRVLTAAGRLVAVLAARRAAGGGPLAVVSCDNLPANDAAARAALLGTARRVDEDLADWIERTVAFVGTSIDRITPRTTDADREAVAAATGFADVSPVITEPFSSWILAGDFPAGRPAWERAGAVFVEDLEPFERRKLWLLNGAHTLMAYAGPLRGHATVAQALADPTVAGWVEEFWDAAARHLTTPGLDVPAYRQALRDRFANPRIAHHLAQIGNDGSLKLAARALPVYRAERDAGRDGTAALRPVAAWMDRMTAQLADGTPITDPAADRITAAAGTGGEDTAALLAVVDATLARDADAVAAVAALRGTLTA